MILDDTQKILANIIQGVVVEGQTDYLTAARNYIYPSFGTSTKIERNFEKQSAIKKEQAEQLTRFALEQGLLPTDFLDEGRFLAEGGEARVYLDPGDRTVTKLNDAIYYYNWLDFLNSVLIHNLLF